MRLAFAALFAAALFAVPFLSGAAPTPLPRLLGPEIRLPIATPTPAAAQPACTLPLPSKLTVCIPKQSPAFKPTALVDFSLSGAQSTGATGGGGGKKPAIQATITLAAGSAASDMLVGWYTTNHTLQKLYVFQPPSTMNEFTKATIVGFNENATGTSGATVFTISYQMIAITNISTGTHATDSWNVP